MGRRFIFTALLLSLCTAVSAQEQVSETRSNLERHVRTLASDRMLGRRAGTDQGMLASSYIVFQFEEMGLRPGADDGEGKSFMQRFERYSGRYANVVGFIPGSDPELRDEYIVLGAHYDHLGYRLRGRDTVIYHGADDNASGTAVLIEAARKLMEREGELKRTVIIAAFDAEEIGLYGSEAMAANMDIDKVKFMASIDMVGWLREAGYLEIEHAGSLAGWQELFASIPCPAGLQVKPLSDGGSLFTGSDHDSFTAESVPAVLLTTGTKSPYHKPEDTADKIDYEGLELITEYVAAMATELSECDRIVPSDKLLRKREGPRTVEFAVSGSIGSSYMYYGNGAAVNGAPRFSWNAGAFLQFNINDVFAIRPEVIYNHRTFRYPQQNPSGELIVTDSFRKMVSPTLTGPVNLLLKTAVDSDYYMYVGVGGYYSYVFDTRLDGEPIPYNRHEGGISMTVGWNIRHVGAAFTGYYPLSRMSSEIFGKRGFSAFFTMYYKF